MKPVSMASPSRQPSKCGCSGPFLQFRNHYIVGPGTTHVDAAPTNLSRPYACRIPCEADLNARQIDALCELGLALVSACLALLVAKHQCSELFVYFELDWTNKRTIKSGRSQSAGKFRAWLSSKSSVFTTTANLHFCKSCSTDLCLFWHWEKNELFRLGQHPC